MADSKVILITGCSSGFGYLSAKDLASKGHTVYASMRNTTTKNAEVTAELNALDNITVLDLDVTSEDSVTNAVNTVIQSSGTVDVLINNAGGGGAGLMENFSTAEVMKQFDVNVFGVFRVTKAVLPHMREKKDGLLLHISSIMGRFTAPMFSMYCASKYALEAMAEAWKYELRPIGVDTVIVEPGAFPTTSFGQNMVDFSPQNPELIAQYGEVAFFPQKFGEMLQGMVESGNYQKPEMVTDAIDQIINTPKGQRPLRVVVDENLAEMFDKHNQQSRQLQQMMMNGFQMGDLFW